MPRIWIDYCQFLVDQCKVTRTRRTFDRALRALPITQHRRIWPLYLKFVRKYHIPETAVRVYRRYLKVFHSTSFKQLWDFLGQLGRHCTLYNWEKDFKSVVNNDGQSKYSFQINHRFHWYLTWYCFKSCCVVQAKWQRSGEEIFTLSW